MLSHHHVNSLKWQSRSSSRFCTNAVASFPRNSKRSRPSAEVSTVSEDASTSSRGDVHLAEFGTNVTLLQLERAFGKSVGAVSRMNQQQAADQLWAPGYFSVTVDDKPQRTKNQEKTGDYFANVGDAIRTLREDIPELFERDLNYGIYREDIMFKDPRNSFQGMKNYKLIFWSLRFHGRIFFKKLYVEVKRIWQPEDCVIKMRWTVHGIPRVPWEAEGTFDGVSTYRLDKSGRVYEHSVDNVLLRDPPMLTNLPLLAGLNLSPLQPQQTPQLGVYSMDQQEEPEAQLSSSNLLRYYYQFSWVRLYAALQATLHVLSSCNALASSSSSNSSSSMPLLVADGTQS